MKKAAILGGGFDQKKLVQEFNDRGFQTILFDYYQNPPAKGISSKHYQISTYDKDSVLEACRYEHIDVIGTISTDQPLVTAAYASEQLEIYHPISYQQAISLTNKEHMKKILVENGIPTPRFLVIEPGDDISFLDKLSLPIVVKPVDSSGSRGVSFVYDYEVFERSCAFARDNSRSGKIIVEEKIDGLLVSTDIIINNSIADILVFIDNFMFDDKPGLFRKMQYPSTINKEAVIKISNIVQRVSEAFELSNTPLFIQFFVTDNNDIYLLELSARIAGGSKPYLIPRLCGVDMVNAYVSQILQEPLHYEIRKNQNFLTCNYIWGGKGLISSIEGLELLISKEVIDFYGLFKGPGDYINGLTNGSDRIGVFYISGDNWLDIKNKSDFADQTVKVFDDNLNDIMIHNIY